MNQYFKPTYLYIKRHPITGKCYFGKTTGLNPEKYLGSGVLWKKHIKKHGKEFVETLWIKLLQDREECTRIALLFSEQQDIVHSDLWLNLIPETGLSGWGSRTSHSSETREKMSKSKMGNTIMLRFKHSDRSKENMSKSKMGNTIMLGFKHSEESRRKMRKSKSEEHKRKISESLKGNRNRCNNKVR